MQLKSGSVEETKKVGAKLATLLQGGEIICLYGDLGAGKTAFSQGLGKGLGVKENITSPTFMLINEYEGRIPFYHMDVYRLSGWEDMADLGYEEYFDGDGVTLVEWANIVEEVLPQERLDVKITVEEENKRLIELIPFSIRYEKMVKELWQSVHTGN